MCWSGEASAVLATAGLSTTYYIAKTGESRSLWIPLGYFSLMELLQALTYAYINQCDTPQNQLLTFFGYIHIVFQPLFINMVALYFIPDAVRRIIEPYVYALCAIGSLSMLVKMYPFPWAGLCDIGSETFCGATACSLSGDWHIAWQLPLNGLLSKPIDYLYDMTYGIHGAVYILAGFVLPFLYGSWRMVLFHFLAGPFLSRLLTTNPNEFPAVWCLLSIALCASVIKTPIRQHLHVHNWFFYNRAPGIAHRQRSQVL